MFEETHCNFWVALDHLEFKFCAYFNALKDSFAIKTGI